MTYWNEITFATTIVPPGYLRIPDAFEIIGRHFFSAVGTWTGEESKFDERIVHLPPCEAVYGSDGDRIIDKRLYNFGSPIVRRVLSVPSEPQTNLTRDQWQQADDLRTMWKGKESELSDRQLHIFWVMYRLGMSGNPTYCHVDSKGGIRELDKSNWNVTWDVACDRFEHGALNIKPEYAMRRPVPWNDGEGYLEFFAVPLLVKRDMLLARVRKLPVFRPDDAEGDAETSTQMVDRFFQDLEAAKAGEEELPEGGGVLPQTPDLLANLDPLIAAWAMRATERNVAIRNAGEDARQHIPQAGITVTDAKNALKAAKQLAGKTIRRGRPIGSKSFANSHKSSD